MTRHIVFKLCATTRKLTPSNCGMRAEHKAFAKVQGRQFFHFANATKQLSLLKSISVDSGFEPHAASLENVMLHFALSDV